MRVRTYSISILMMARAISCGGYEAADKILLVVSDALIDMVDADNYKDLAGIRVSLGAGHHHL